MSIRRIPCIARPSGLHYTHFVSPSDPIAYLLAVGEEYSYFFNHIFCSHFAYTYACQHSGMQNHIFDGRGFAEHQSSLWWSISENLHNS